MIPRRRPTAPQSDPTRTTAEAREEVGVLREYRRPHVGTLQHARRSSHVAIRTGDRDRVARDRENGVVERDERVENRRRCVAGGRSSPSTHASTWPGYRKSDDIGTLAGERDKRAWRSISRRYEARYSIRSGERGARARSACRAARVVLLDIAPEPIEEPQHLPGAGRRRIERADHQHPAARERRISVTQDGLPHDQCVLTDKPYRCRSGSARAVPTTRSWRDKRSRHSSSGWIAIEPLDTRTGLPPAECVGARYARPDFRKPRSPGGLVDEVGEPLKRAGRIARQCVVAHDGYRVAPADHFHDEIANRPARRRKGGAVTGKLLTGISVGQLANSLPRVHHCTLVADQVRDVHVDGRYETECNRFEWQARRIDDHARARDLGNRATRCGDRVRVGIERGPVLGRSADSYGEAAGVSANVRLRLERDRRPRSTAARPSALDRAGRLQPESRSTSHSSVRVRRNRIGSSASARSPIVCSTRLR